MMPQEAERSRFIMARCTQLVSEVLARPERDIDPDTKFSRLGLDSAMSIHLLVALEEWLGLELPTDMIFEQPTIAKLSRFLADRIEAVPA